MISSNYSFQSDTKKLHDIEKSIAYYSHAIGLLYYDMATNPHVLSTDFRSKTMSFLTGERHHLQTSDETWEIIDNLSLQFEQLSVKEQSMINFFRKYYAFERCIPKERFIEYMEIVHKSESEWRIAKKNNDFSVMIPFYKLIISYQKEFAHYYNPARDPYDILLERYEFGFTQNDYDTIVQKIKDKIIPLVHSIQKKKKCHQCNNIIATCQAQKDLSHELMKLMGLEDSFCTLGETEHPFTIKVCRNDIRITTKIIENNPLSNYFTTLHEGGHAIYEHYMDEAFNGSILCEGASMGIHESQSRFFENYIGRNYYFLSAIRSVLEKLLHTRIDGDASDFYKTINTVEPSLIRTEADELTYPIHIIIRYELEKKLFNDEIEIENIEFEWKRLYYEYLGVEVPSSSQGVLQDSHWSGGSFGYFPSYLLGSAYAAQLLYALQQDIDFCNCLSTLDFRPIINWLSNKVYKFGPTKEPKDILLNATGEVFNIDYYIDYLMTKYKCIYEL